VKCPVVSVVYCLSARTDEITSLHQNYLCHGSVKFNNSSTAGNFKIQWKPLILITLGPALFDNNNRLVTLSGGYKNLHYLTQFIVTTFYMYKKQNLFKKHVVLPVVCLHLVVPE
jgi:hypothetical protein